MRFFLLVLFLFIQGFNGSLLKAEESKKETVSENKNDLLQQLKEHIPYSSQGRNEVGYITIDDKTSGINSSTWLYVKSALDHYKKIKPVFVILELNTPGGEIYVSQKIADALKELDTQHDIPVVAFINNWAISAGALIAYSCRFIAVVKDASMGAAEPVIAGSSGLLEEASEKVNSAIRTDFASRATFFGRNPLLAEAMVDKDLILVERKGKIVRLDQESQIRTDGENPDLVITPKGKLLTLNSEQMMNYGVADILLLPKKLPGITPEEREKGKWPADKMLLFDYSYFKDIPNAYIDAFPMDWKTKFFAFLANPIVSSILFMMLMIGFYVEMNTPGFGVAGSLALSALFLILLSSFAQEAANWLELILLVTGALIILVDLIVLPTFGILGIIGFLLCLGGLIGLMLPGLESVDFDKDTQTWNAAGEFVLERFIWLCAAFLVGIGVIALLARYVLPKSSPFNKFVLKGSEQDASKGYYAGENPKNMPHIGAKGTVVSTLRPSGKIQIDEMIFEALTNGEFIESGTPIQVVRLDGSAVIVKEIEES